VTSKSFQKVAIFIDLTGRAKRSIFATKANYRSGMKHILKTAFLTLLAAAIPAGASAQAPIEGLWKNPSGTAIIAVTPCGGALCGKVAWASARGQQEVSRNTPKVVGTTVLTGLRASGNRWNGSLYIPDDNIHVSARLQLLNGRQLKLTGCAFAGLFCRSQIWTRADALPKTS
jgi:uncharacterized protein (DUF2147 family)